MIEVLDVLLRQLAAGRPVVVCAVVKTRGSTPQKAGAVMLVLGDGATVGTIGGGCVEAEVRTRALTFLAAPGATLLRFKLDHDLGWDDGLVCGGTMEVAMTTVTDAAPYAAARQSLAAGSPARFSFAVTDQAGHAVTFEQTCDPVPELLIAGAGHVGAAVAAVAAVAGFEVAVTDDRPDYLTPDRFPRARLVPGDVETVLRNWPVHPRTCVVIVTRGHRRDGAALAAVVASPAAYVGLIGSKRKVLTIFEGLKARGVSPAALEAVHAPIGLDIGAVTPGEIAVSIVAELIAVRRKLATPGTPMRVSPSRY